MDLGTIVGILGIVLAVLLWAVPREQAGAWLRRLRERSRLALTAGEQDHVGTSLVMPYRVAGRTAHDVSLTLTSDGASR